MPLLTMLFTDVVGSSATKRDVALGRDNKERDQAYLDQVQTPHFALVRASCQAHHGQEVSTMGDAFFLAFDEPVQAVRCAVDIQQRLAATPVKTPMGPLRLRIGVHSGFPEFFEGSWHGADVDATARVEAQASPEQILISSRTYELVRHMSDTKFYSQGQFELKGVGQMHLWEVDWSGGGKRPTPKPSLDAIARRKRLMRGAAAALAAILFVGAGFYFYRRYQSGLTIWPTKARPTVAVMGFKNLGKPEVAWLSDALSEMLSTELFESGVLRTIPSEDVSVAKADLGLMIAPTFSVATLAKIHRILRSEYVISGTYVAMGNNPADSIRVDLRVQEAASGETISSFMEEGNLATLSSVLRKAGIDLRIRLGVRDASVTAQGRQQSTLPSDPEALRLYTDGLVKLRAFDALGAKDDFEKCISLEPNLALPWEALASAWQLLGYDQKAKEASKKAVELSGNLPPQEQRAIESHYHELNSDWNRAIAIYQALQVLYPDDPNYALALAKAQTNAGKAQDALATLAKLEKDPQMKDDPRVDFSIALAAESLSDAHKEHDAAAAAAAKAKQQGSRLLAAHAYWQLCSADFDLGQFQDGEAACEASHSSAPFDDDIAARSDTVWASILQAQGKNAEALGMRRKALETARKIGSQKDVVGALQNLGDLLDSQGQSDEAHQDYNQALQLARSIGDQAGAVRVTDSLAAHYQTSGDYLAAESFYKQSLETAMQISDKATAANALTNLSGLQTQLGQLDAAEKNIQQGISLYKESGAETNLPAALDVRGDLFLIRADLPNARKQYEEALALATKQQSPPSLAGVRAEIASLDLEDNKAADAEPLARQAADEFASEKLVDQEADARDTLARSLLAQGKLPDARAEIDRASKLHPQDRVVALSLAITNARLKEKEAKGPEARKILDASLAESSKSKLTGVTLQIKLAQADVAASANPKSAGPLFSALQRDATANGYLLIASQAQNTQNSRSQH
jgi:class 3 adenylate cyclase/tetratricopeptide (TPR) repeat protein/TolB-like protein